MFCLCFTIIWMLHYANSYPSNVTELVLNGISLQQTEPSKLIIVAIVVPIACVLLISAIIFISCFVMYNKDYQLLKDSDSEIHKPQKTPKPSILPSGLNNTAETCYMNSMIQAMASSESLIKEFDSIINRFCSETKFVKLKKLVFLLKAINDPKSDHDNVTENTNLFQEIMKESNWHLVSQQDSFHLLSAVINAIQKDVVEILKESETTMPPKFNLLHTFTENADYNKVQDHLGLPVPLCGDFRKYPGEKLENLMDAFFKPSDIDDGTYKMQIYFYRTVPKTLIIHIQANEWDYDKNEYMKPKYYIQYKEKMDYQFQIQMKPDGSEIQKITETYHLSAIVSHMGTVTEGHYVTYRKYQGGWCLANDEQVEKVQFPGDKVPYIMVYEKECLENK